jgi:hypothetical protein
MGFGAAPVCSETFTMAEDPKASAVGESLLYHQPFPIKLPQVGGIHHLSIPKYQIVGDIA